MKIPEGFRRSFNEYEFLYKDFSVLLGNPKEAKIETDEMRRDKRWEKYTYINI